MKIFQTSTQALKWCTLFNLGMVAIAIIGILVDDRLLLGESVWLKPLKFGISIPIYCITIALLLQVYPYSDSIKKWIARLIGWSLILEIPLVMIQAARGVRSHFNISTLFDNTIFGLMGILIFINTLVLFYMMGTAFFKKLNTPINMQRAIQFAWLAMIISIVAGQQMIAANGHAVGVPDGGEGLPITHWSTKGGDWRAVHFLGMHAIQVLPLLAYLMNKLKWEKIIAQWSISIIGILYLAIISYIFVQTKLGIPFWAS